MTTSVFGWLDQDDRERNRMLEIVNLFREQGTQDELGAAQIRDALSDRFFPGTTTVQTRARYFLFIPWIHLQLEREQAEAGEGERRHRILHGRLVESLSSGEESNRGIIGIYAGQSLQNLPSGIYWTGLKAWGIRKSGESIERYAEAQRSSPASGAESHFGESGELVSRASRYWHPGIPGAPENLFERTTFALTQEEAEFLEERIIANCRGSLLEGCLSKSVRNVESARFPWELHGLEALDTKLREDIENARRFALLAEGAALLYNLMLAELAVESGVGEHEERARQYAESFAKWADEVDSEQDELQAWDRPAFWNRIRELRPTLRPGAERFFDRWMEMAISDPRSLPGNAEARNLISSRERLLKGSLARLHHRRPLERWSGASGLGRTTFRWPTAKSHLIDILRGLGRESELAHA